MRKLKWILMSAAIFLAIGSAVGMKYVAFCETQQQYFQWGGQFWPVSGYGTNYRCLNTSGTCTWWQPNPFGGYVPCKTGTFSFIF